MVGWGALRGETGFSKSTQLLPWERNEKNTWLNTGKMLAQLLFHSDFFSSILDNGCFHHIEL